MAPYTQAGLTRHGSGAEACSGGLANLADLAAGLPGLALAAYSIPAQGVAAVPASCQQLQQLYTMRPAEPHSGSLGWPEASPMLHLLPSSELSSGHPAAAATAGPDAPGAYMGQGHAAVPQHLAAGHYYLIGGQGHAAARFLG